MLSMLSSLLEDAESSAIKLKIHDGDACKQAKMLFDELINIFRPVGLHLFIETQSGQPMGISDDEVYDIARIYGPIRSITQGIVHFIYSGDAEAVALELDGKPFGGLGGILRVLPVQHIPPGAVRKYTCRFDIGIENDKDFAVARRLIGLRGQNMKRIVKQAGFDAKLRLRGRGSGFLEGAHKQESDEPLHLCVSCKELQGYQTAVNLVKELLEEIYDDYRGMAGRGVVPEKDLQVSVHEHPLLYSPHQQGVIQLQEEARVLGPDEIEKLIEDRNHARRVSNFAEADRIRDILRGAGVGLMDEPGGRGKGTEVTTWRYWRNS
jgi:hypothetical protein